MKPHIRSLGCSHCKDVVPHKVYQLKCILRAAEKPGEGPKDKTIVRYEKICRTCKTKDTIEVEKNEWIALLKNKDWEAK